MNCINIVVKPDELCFKLNNFSYKFLSTITRVYTYNMPCFSLACLNYLQLHFVLYFTTNFWEQKTLFQKHFRAENGNKDKMASKCHSLINLPSLSCLVLIENIMPEQNTLKRLITSRSFVKCMLLIPLLML